MLLVFPTSLEALCSRLRVPDSIKQDGGLATALFGWSPTVTSVRAYEWRGVLKNPERENAGISILDRDRRDRTIKNNCMHFYAFEILKFPDWLFQHMSMPNRPYCVWWENGDSTMSEKGFETTLLFSILNQCGAKDVGYKKDVRAVFVHVGALPTLHKLPAFAERRSKRFEVHFFTYGTHESVSPERWGVREIYPLGTRLSSYSKKTADLLQGEYLHSPLAPCSRTQSRHAT